MNPNSERSKIFLPPYFILIFGLLITALISAYIWNAAEEKDDIRFESSIKQVEDAIQERIENYIGLLQTHAGFLALLPNPTFDEYKTFVEKSEVATRFPSIQGVGYIVKVRAENLATFEELSRSNGIAGYSVHPQNLKSEYFPVLYLEPINDKNISTVGYDMSSDESFKKTMDNARDTGKAVISDRINIVDSSDNSQVTEFIIFLPLYQDGIVPATVDERNQKLVGYVYAPFRVDLFVNRILREKAESELEISIYEGDHTQDNNLTYKNYDIKNEDITTTRQINRVHSFPTINNNWTISYKSNANFIRDSDRRFIPLVAILGTLISMLIYINVKTQVSLREQSDERARELRNSRDLLAKSENMKDTVLNSISSHIAVLDKYGNIISVNRAWRKFYLENGGMPYYDWSRTNYIDILEKAASSNESDPNAKVPETVEGTKNVIDKKLAQFSIEYSCMIENKELWFLMQVTPLVFPNSGVVVSHTDITERRRLESQKEEFIGIASHELKTPVTSLKAYAQVLQRRFTYTGDTSSAGMLEKMNNQLDKLTKLIRELLDSTKIESGKIQLNIDTFNIDSLIAEVCEEVERITPFHKITKEGKANKTIVADRDRIGQVLTNLLSNAIKYSPDSDKIIVTASSTDKEVEVCVEDFGIGIPEQDYDKVFERFHRVKDSAHHTFSGLGLGLYICQEIIKRHGGRIYVVKKDTQGTVICFSLPINYEA